MDSERIIQFPNFPKEMRKKKIETTRKKEKPKRNFISNKYDGVSEEIKENDFRIEDHHRNINVGPLMKDAITNLHEKSIDFFSDKRGFELTSKY